MTFFSDDKGASFSRGREGERERERERGEERETELNSFLILGEGKEGFGR